MLTDFLASEEVNKMLGSQNQRWNIEVIQTSCFLYSSASTIWDLISVSKQQARKQFTNSSELPQKMGKNSLT